jgi:pimeloyl-ACP methyl ester carboxylesterase
MKTLLVIALVPAALLIIGLVYQQLGVRRDRAALPPPGQLVNVGGRPVHLYCEGTGTPVVVCEAGIATSSLNWRHVQRAIAPLTRICAYDRPGYGWSPPVGGRRTSTGEAHRLVALLRAAKVPAPWVLVGHSYGGFIVVQAALMHPEQVAAVVLVDPITPDAWRAPSAGLRRRVTGGIVFASAGAALSAVGVLRGLLGRVARGRPGVPRAVLGRFGRDAAALVERMVGQVVGRLSPDLWPAVRAHWSRPSSFTTMAQFLRGLPESAGDVADAMERATPLPAPLGDVPLVVLVAAESDETSLDGRAALARLSRRGELVNAETSGHWIHLDAPELVVNAIERVVVHTRTGAAAS